MARPRVFVSSTYYDLKHIRASLDVFIESLGFDSILSEKGDIAYSPDIPLDASCYKEVTNADMLVLIIGGRYGSPNSKDRTTDTASFFKRYDSITKLEFQEAINRDIPVYILIESSVYSEYQTYLRNKDNVGINYAHVDSINIFLLIEEIIIKPKNNPIKTFDRFSEIEGWLREQWAGLFRELLSRTSQQQQIAALNSQINELKDVNATLKSYMESVLHTVDPNQSGAIIAKEENRLANTRTIRQIKQNALIKYLSRFEIDADLAIDAIANSNRLSEFVSLIADAARKKDRAKSELDELSDILTNNPAALSDVNDIRDLLGKPLWEGPPESSDPRSRGSSPSAPKKNRRRPSSDAPSAS